MEKTIPPGSQATLGYAFIPADAFAGRPFGLSINLAYRDYVKYYFYLYDNLYFIVVYVFRKGNKL